MFCKAIATGLFASRANVENSPAAHTQIHVTTCSGDDYSIIMISDATAEKDADALIFYYAELVAV